MQNPNFKIAATPPLINISQLCTRSIHYYLKNTIFHNYRICVFFSLKSRYRRNSTSSMTSTSAKTTLFRPSCTVQPRATDDMLPLHSMPNISLNELMKHGDFLRSEAQGLVLQDCLDTLSTSHGQRLTDLCSILDDVLAITSDYETRIETPRTMPSQ